MLVAMAIRGMLELDELRELVAQGEVETVVVGLTDLYGRLLGKRFDAEMFLDEVCDHGAHACDYLLTVDMEVPQGVCGADLPAQASYAASELEHYLFRTGYRDIDVFSRQVDAALLESRATGDRSHNFLFRAIR
jgi:hypothetical protein